MSKQRKTAHTVPQRPLTTCMLQLGKKMRTKKKIWEAPCVPWMCSEMSRLLSHSRGRNRTRCYQERLGSFRGILVQMLSQLCFFAQKVQPRQGAVQEVAILDGVRLHHHRILPDLQMYVSAFLQLPCPSGHTGPERNLHRYIHSPSS